MANAAQRKTFVGAVVIGIHVLIGIGFIAVTAIKAVTYHRFFVEQSHTGWVAEVFLDV